MKNAYIDVARQIIREVKVPMRAHTIVHEAALRQLLPSHLKGKTQHKTMGARLSEDILRNGVKSLFFRTRPGEFFLRELLCDPTVPREYKNIIIARRRSKQLHREMVLTIPRSVLEREGVSGLVEDTDHVLAIFKNADLAYVDRKRAEADTTRKQLVTYILVIRGTKVLSYRRGRYSSAADEIRGARSIGFGGHVSDVDTDLWSPELFGITNNSVRELAEELNLANDFRLRRGGKFQLHSFLNVDDTEEASRHIAAIVLYYCPSFYEPKKGELSINDLQWLSIDAYPNKIDDFELWSRLLIDRFIKESTDKWSSRSWITWTAHS
ncbi:hypothetical protein IYW41_14595 [Methylocystis sp. H15]|uniref:HTH domain-containing protein n=1 Tax=Methylocystis sp. H15 TaxID=2785787 RepID=UPI0018C26B2B|nr:HTH domain-containing protein [Methylocystis sp. H15]MBG0806824.1 hypothetical protein [Methylocystis sp. H15]